MQNKVTDTNERKGLLSEKCGDTEIWSCTEIQVQRLWVSKSAPVVVGNELGSSLPFSLWFPE